MKTVVEANSNLLHSSKRVREERCRPRGTTGRVTCRSTPVGSAPTLAPSQSQQRPTVTRRDSSAAASAR